MCSQKTGWSTDTQNTNPTTHSPTLSTEIPPQHLNSACVYSGLVTTGTDSKSWRGNCLYKSTWTSPELGNAPVWRNLKWACLGILQARVHYMWENSSLFPQFLVLLREAQRQDHRLVAIEDDKSPTLSSLPTLIIAHWFQASQVFVAGAEDAALFQWQREYGTASGNRVSIHSFWRNARREPAIFPYRSLNVFICSSDTEWIMEAHPQAPKAESWRIFCLPVKH